MENDKTLSNDKVTLQYLTARDAAIFYKMYTHPFSTDNYNQSPVLPNETPTQFVNRIISNCERIFTIRPIGNPDLIIGDCALHHWDKQKREIEIGGSLLPEYLGKGYMKAAFELLLELAKRKFEVITAVGITETKNANAIKFAEKMGFVMYGADGRNVIMRKDLQ